jgi:hypothetical protein
MRHNVVSVMGLPQRLGGREVIAKSEGFSGNFPASLVSPYLAFSYAYVDVYKEVITPYNGRQLRVDQSDLPTP